MTEKENTEHLLHELHQSVSETAEKMHHLVTEANLEEHQEKMHAVKEQLARLHEANQEEKNKQEENKKHFLNQHFETIHAVNEAMLHTAAHLNHHFEELSQDNVHLQQLRELREQLAKHAEHLAELEKQHHHQQLENAASSSVDSDITFDTEPSNKKRTEEVSLPHPHPGGFKTTND